jgi:hypothetical protein
MYMLLYAGRMQQDAKPTYKKHVHNIGMGHAAWRINLELIPLTTDLTLA